MLENLLGGILGMGGKPEPQGEKQEDGMSGIIRIVILLVIGAGILKFLKNKEEEPQ